ncbi:MAG: 4-hydroxy-2-oxoglutarate aldolase, mitochondrial [Acidobacteria bacterium]|nr:4-hydroxy-2-oxoglutarate aldolase, mitochondrial [Acidobacteriota bacterium]
MRGILLPFPTPFDFADEVDPGALRSNLERWNGTGIAGYACLGSTGERVHLHEREYLEVIEAARESVPADLAFIVGAGQQSTRGSIDEIKNAVTAGADAVLVITPSFYRSAITQAALIEHYTAIAEASPVPIILYSMPALTGIKIEPPTIAQLGRHPNIIGVKDSSADIEALAETVRLVRGNSEQSSDPHASEEVMDSRRDDFAVLTGNGTVLYQALRAGADGGILAVGCVAPQLCLDVFRAVKAGENETAQLLQEKLTPLAQAVTTKYGIGGLKAGLDLIGYFGGPVRAPLPAPDEAARSEIGQLLEGISNNGE